MFRDIIPVLFSLAIALVGGIFVTDEVTHNFEGFGALQIGDWTAYPTAGSQSADPYARARAARTGQIGLGSAEGLAFVAKQDSDGQPLSANCRYTLLGNTTAARAWTLRVTDDQFSMVPTNGGDIPVAHSGGVLRNTDGSFAIGVSSSPISGNWVQFAGKGNLFLVLTLYDTSVASTAGISDYTMPAINRISCDD